LSDPGPFFIAGTGRSGTSQLARVIGDHPQVHSLADETRFIVDPGGLEDLARALTTAYTPYHADDALRRFDYVMSYHVTGKAMTAFNGWDVPGMVGSDRYWRELSGLWESLIWYEFEEIVPGDEPLIFPPVSPFRPGRFLRVVARYFASREELIAVLSSFVNRLFSGAAGDHGKPAWCEKTPFNLLSMPFLWELFPEATIVHVIRHPEDVVASHMDQGWAPSDLEAAVSWLEPIYDRWLRFRDTAELSAGQYVEVRLEELAHEWPQSRGLLFAALGLPDAETEHTIDPRHVHHRREQLTPEERSLVNRRLSWAIAALGYEPR
jgi:hypothetical protein